MARSWLAHPNLKPKTANTETNLAGVVADGCALQRLSG
jgi:hypothetical protein